MAPTGVEAIVRRARPHEADALNTVIIRSKGHWGYAEPIIEAYRAFLSLEPAFIERNPVYCADVDGAIAGVSHFNVVDRGEIELSHLFVDPAFIGRGIGTLLWRHAVEVSRSMGGAALVFDSDPHARTFYERLGAVVVGDHESTVVAGLRIPRLRYEL